MQHTTNAASLRMAAREIIGRLSTAQLVLLSAALATVALLLTGHLDVLKAINLGDGAGSVNGEGSKFSGLMNAIHALQGPANVAVGSLGGLGVAGGAAMIAVGSPKGGRILAGGAGGLAALALGNGVIQ